MTMLSQHILEMKGILSSTPSRFEYIITSCHSVNNKQMCATPTTECSGSQAQSCNTHHGGHQISCHSFAAQDQLPQASGGQLQRGPIICPGQNILHSMTQL